MKKRSESPKRPPILRARLDLNQDPVCLGPDCGRTVDPMHSGLYLVHDEEAHAWCSRRCFLATMAEALQLEWANQGSRTDLIQRMGYAPAAPEASESGPPLP